MAKILYCFTNLLFLVLSFLITLQGIGGAMFRALNYHNAVMLKDAEDGVRNTTKMYITVCFVGFTQFRYTCIYPEIKVTGVICQFYYFPLELLF